MDKSIKSTWHTGQRLWTVQLGCEVEYKLILNPFLHLFSFPSLILASAHFVSQYPVFLNTLFVCLVFLNTLLTRCILLYWRVDNIHIATDINKQLKGSVLFHSREESSNTQSLKGVPHTTTEVVVQSHHSKSQN